MNQNLYVKKKTIDLLKSYIALQLQAYYQQNWELYDALEEKIRTIEKKIAI